MNSFLSERNSYRPDIKPNLSCNVTTGKHQWFPHGMPLSIGYMLTPLILDRIWVEFRIVELPNPLKSVRHCKLPKRQTSRVSYTT